jgi:hypothetical protein
VIWWRAIICRRPAELIHVQLFSFQVIAWSAQLPMLGHPAAMYAYGAAYAMGAAWLGHKMHTSHIGIVRKLWWLPQTYSIEQNVYGFAYTRAHYHR